MNYYELLNIARDANDGEIKRAYFSAVKAHSPDSDPEGFKAIRTAYEILSDPNNRDQYDTWFDAPDGIQNEVLAARELFRENKYRQALDFLIEQGKRRPDSVEIKRLYAEALLYVNKVGTADKVCRELLEKDPLDYDTYLLRAKIAAAREHGAKCEEYILEAISISPMNPKAWIMYMNCAMYRGDDFILSVFKRAMKQSSDMFRDAYLLYLVGAGLLDDSRDNNLFHQVENYLNYYDKFADYFINDKNHERAIYDSLMIRISSLVERSECVPFIEKVLPALENSKCRIDEDAGDFKHIHAAITITKLRADERLHAILSDLTEFFLMGDEDNDNRLGMECYIVFHLAAVRPSIKTLRKEYPECFKLNQSFYLDVLNEKKTEYLTDKYMAIYNKLPPVEIDKGNDDEVSFVKGFEFEEIKTFTRETPKTGRNDPCHCGSGKKYKKCCGA